MCGAFDGVADESEPVAGAPSEASAVGCDVAVAVGGLWVVDVVGFQRLGGAGEVGFEGGVDCFLALVEERGDRDRGEDADDDDADQ